MLHICVQIEEDISPPLEVKATCLGDHDFRVEADGVIMDVSLAVYLKVNAFLCKHSAELHRLIYQNY